MKLLHTSDWHLGQNFMGQSRAEEHKAFLDWLLETLERESIDVLVVAGDIFDTGTPANYALKLYYNFLTQIAQSRCKHIIITAGNHDSISTLKAPQELLSVLGISVITSGDEDEIVEIVDGEEMVGIVCAVPFLRDSMVRHLVASQTASEQESALSLGIKEHYNSVYQEAKLRSKQKKIPIIATGHLTTVGSKVSDSEREIYIGGTLDIDRDFLGKEFDYVALGHLHTNQKVGCEHVRYSGSPIPLSFSEASSAKAVNIVSFAETISVEVLPIPLYRRLMVIRGDLESIQEALEKVKDKSTWIEVYLKDDNPISANQAIRRVAKKLQLTLLAVKTQQNNEALHSSDIAVVSLDELTPIELFEKRIELDGLKDKELKDAMLREFAKIVDELEML